MIRVLICGPCSTSGGVANHTRNLVQNLRSEDVEVTWIKITGSKFRKIYNRSIGFFFHGFINRHRYEIIHVQFSAGIASLLEAVTGSILTILTKKKLIITYHNSTIPKTLIFSFILHHSNAIVFVSRHQQRTLSDRYPHYSEKTIVIPNGYDRAIFFPLDQQKCKEQLRLPCKRELIVTVGNLLTVKGHRYLIEAVNIIQQTRDSIICVIIGTGPLAVPLSDQIVRYGLEDSVILAGESTQSEVNCWLNACDLFVLPSLRESFGVVQIEAMACGKPVVATRNGGSEEIVIEGETGFLAEAGNAEDLAEKITKGLNHKWDRIALHSYTDQFIWTNISKKMIDVYSAILSEQYLS